jgi:hypothetical protein
VEKGVNFHQSFSGSETDVSTSTENLTPEEQYYIRHTQRQDPPGEENIHAQYHHIHRQNQALAQQTQQQQQPSIHSVQISHVSAASSCGRSYDSSSCNTMIVHSDSTLDEKFLTEYIYNPSPRTTAAAAAAAANYSSQGQMPSFRQPPPYSAAVSAAGVENAPTTRVGGAGKNDPLYSNVSELNAALAQQQQKTGVSLDTSMQEISDIPSRYLDTSQVW